jgi:REP element-mobilizing transposase RayT
MSLGNCPPSDSLALVDRMAYSAFIKMARQLELTPRTWGGRRRGAGRKPTGKAGVPHRTRAPLASRHPVHVTLKLLPDKSGLRRGRMIRRLRAVFRTAREHDGFRLCHFGVQPNHLHLLCEGSDAAVLGRGIQALEIRMARAVNKALGRSGRVFADRYHARALKTPTEVRNALRYVLANRRHHARGPLAFDWFDPCSSAAWFDGWKEPLPTREPWMRELLAEETAVAQAHTWLLTAGWRLRGLLSIREAPA